MDPIFSVVSIWEVAVKFALGRPDFRIDPNVVRRGVLDVGLRELEVKGEHALAIASLPPIHRDPFVRIVIAQAQVEQITLLTADATIARYPGPIRLV